MNDDYSIHSSIRKLRFEAHEMTQQELADKVKVSRQTIAAIEKNNYSPTLRLAFNLAQVFDVEIGEVFSYKLKESDA